MKLSRSLCRECLDILISFQCAIWQLQILISGAIGQLQSVAACKKVSPHINELLDPYGREFPGMGHSHAPGIAVDRHCAEVGFRPLARGRSALWWRGLPGIAAEPVAGQARHMGRPAKCYFLHLSGLGCMATLA
jgi:hypothetical protein